MEEPVDSVGSRQFRFATIVIQLGGVGSQFIQVGRNHFQGAISSQRLDDIHEQGKGRGRRLKRDNVSQILARGGVRGDV